MIRRVLIANRSEIAVRVARAAADLGIESVAIYGTDEANALHRRRATHSVALPGAGVAAYLDIDAMLAAAAESDADAVHPGYGFFAEQASAADACRDAGLVFVGPSSAVLRNLGDKVAARDLARSLDIPVIPGATDVAGARELFAIHGGVMLKASHGGGGRGMRAVTDPADLRTAWDQCRSEAAAFGESTIYAEALLYGVRHIEVQMIGDGASVLALSDRDCSVQRQRQKLIEIAPASLPVETRDALHDAATRLATATNLDNVATMEFLVHDQGWAFLEVNPRIQVEHTVTEQVTGVDIVQAQLRLAGGATLADLGLDEPPLVRGVAMECRVNTEIIRPDGSIRPTAGVIDIFEPPAGNGIRVDTHGTAGMATHPAFDSLLAKVIVTADSFDDVVRRMGRALAEFRIEGVATNAALLTAILDHPDFGQDTDTRFLDRVLPSLASQLVPDVRAAAPTAPAPSPKGPSTPPAPGTASTPLEIDLEPPVSVPTPAPTDGSETVVAPVLGTIARIVAAGEEIAAGGTVAIIEAMKMEHVVVAPCAGVVDFVDVIVGDTVSEGDQLISLIPGDVDAVNESDTGAIDLDTVRDDLAETRARHAYGLDAQRPDAVAKRHKLGFRTARENLDDLLDPGSFIEYGALIIAAQRRRRSEQDLIEKTPGDGLVAGVGTVNGVPTAVLSYDYTVLAGTQGLLNHRKKDRLFEIIEAQRLPVVFYTEGGGGRPGDTDGAGVAGLDCLAFEYFARLSALVPMVGIVNGRCFAGNAALLGCCDVVISTETASIGMGGPAMIEGGGLGTFAPDEVGPAAMQFENGVIDVLVPDEAAATAAAKTYLGFFESSQRPGWSAPDQRLLRHVVPENRLRVYDMREVITGLADEESVLELRGGFGLGIVTALARVEGRPLGIVANNPTHLAGALDPEGCDKAARFLQLCDAHDLPVLFLCDTPGFMVGPEIEQQAMVRKAGRLFVTAANLSVPVFTIVIRKGYGLGAQAMAGGSFHAPLFTISWPTGEFGGMGLEGAVKLGYRKELEAIEDPEERARTYDEMVARMYTVGKGLNMAAHFEIDAVIDPADSRHWITTTLQSVPQTAPRTTKKRPNIDAC